MDLVINQQGLKIIILCILGLATVTMLFQNKKNKPPPTLMANHFIEESEQNHQEDIKSFVSEEKKNLLKQISRLINKRQQYHLQPYKIWDSSCSPHNSIISCKLSQPLGEGEVISDFKNSFTKMEPQQDEEPIRELKTNQQLLFSRSNQFDETTKKQRKTKFIRKLKGAIDNSKGKRKERLKKLKENLKKQENAIEEEKKEEKQGEKKEEKRHLPGITIHNTTQIFYT